MLAFFVGIPKDGNGEGQDAPGRGLDSSGPLFFQDEVDPCRSRLQHPSRRKSTSRWRADAIKRTIAGKLTGGLRAKFTSKIQSPENFFKHADRDPSGILELRETKSI